MSKGEDALNVGKSSSQESALLSCVLPSAPGGKTAPALSWEAVCATLLVFGIFFVVVTQNRKNSRLMLEKETVEAENRV